MSRIKTIRALGIVVCLVAVVAVARAVARTPAGQNGSSHYYSPEVQRFELLGGHGSELGVSIRDVEKADVSREKLSSETGAVIDEVRSDSPASKAGLKAGDVVTDFDGERVRSARQLTRLVQETPAGRQVKMAVMRGGQRVEVSVEPAAANGFAMFQGGRPLEKLDRLSQDFKFDLPELRKFELPHFDFDLRGRTSRLGVSLSELTEQLSEHFGVKDGVLVTEVASGSPARDAGVKAGDVITSINGQAVSASSDIRRYVSETAGGELTIGVMREKKELSLKAKIERSERPRRSGTRRII